MAGFLLEYVMSENSVLKRPEAPFTQVPDSVLCDPELSAKAKGLFAYLLSKPPDWQFHLSHVRSEFSDGKTSINTAFDDLESRGYLNRHRERRSNGTFGPYIYELRLEPDSSSAENPRRSDQRGKSAPDNPRRDSNKEGSNNEGSNNDVDSTSTPAPAPAHENIHPVAAQIGDAFESNGFQRPPDKALQLLAKRIWTRAPEADDEQAVKYARQKITEVALSDNDYDARGAYKAVRDDADEWRSVLGLAPASAMTGGHDSGRTDEWAGGDSGGDETTNGIGEDHSTDDPPNTWVEQQLEEGNFTEDGEYIGDGEMV